MVLEAAKTQDLFEALQGVAENPGVEKYYIEEVTFSKIRMGINIQLRSKVPNLKNLRKHQKRQKDQRNKLFLVSIKLKSNYFFVHY